MDPLSLMTHATNQATNHTGPVGPIAAVRRRIAIVGSALRALVDLRDRQLQKARIQFGNRLRAIQRGADPSLEAQREVLRRYAEAFAELEHAADTDIARLVRDHPLYPQLAQLKGIGPLLAAKFVAMVPDIESFTTVSKFWRFCGYAVIDGHAERLVAGEKAHFSRRMKAVCYLLGVSFLRSNSPYRQAYDRARAYYDQTRPDWTPSHRHLAAMRKMIKLFLAHAWERWRIAEGLPIRAAYVHDYLRHPTVIRPEEYGWPPLDGWDQGWDIPMVLKGGDEDDGAPGQS
jgi:hypothetical protein